MACWVVLRSRIWQTWHPQKGNLSGGKLWKIMVNYGKIMVNYGKIMVNYGKIMVNYGIYVCFFNFLGTLFWNKPYFRKLRNEHHGVAGSFCKRASLISNPLSCPVKLGRIFSPVQLFFQCSAILCEDMFGGDKAPIVAAVTAVILQSYRSRSGARIWNRERIRRRRTPSFRSHRSSSMLGKRRAADRSPVCGCTLW